MEKMPLVGLTEIAQAAGVQKAAVAMWRTRHDDFPQPVADLRTGPVFWWPEVETWLSWTGRSTDQNWSLDQVNAYQKRGRAYGSNLVDDTTPAPTSRSPR